MGVPWQSHTSNKSLDRNSFASLTYLPPSLQRGSNQKLKPRWRTRRDEKSVCFLLTLWSLKKLQSLKNLETNQAIARLLHFQETSTILNQLVAAASQIYLKWLFFRLIFFSLQSPQWTCLLDSFPASLKDQAVRTAFPDFWLVRTALMKDDLWQLLATSGNFWQLLSTFGNLWQLKN